MHQPQGDSIWGNINTCIEIALNVYAIYAEKGEGIMIPKEEAEKMLSSEGLAKGKEKDGWICYDGDSKDIPMYEILGKRLEACKKIMEETQHQMKEMELKGKVHLSDYFGELLPPVVSEEKTAVQKTADQLQKVRNGIYFMESEGETALAIHEKVAEYFLSVYGVEFGRKQGDYLLYDLDTSAIPLNELKSVFPEVESLILSTESMNATIHNKFQTYEQLYNRLVPEQLKIPAVDGPISLFLRQQLEKESNKEYKEVFHEETNHLEQEDDFGEQVEYGFEP